MMTKLPGKYNDSGVKIFELLKLLTEDNASYENVIELFSADTKNNPNVTLNKYLNALKIFGLKIKKYKKKYHLLNSPYTLDLSANDINSIKLLTEFLEVFPENKSKDAFYEFLKDIEIRTNEDAKNTLKNNTNENLNFKFYFEEYKELIEECEKYCIDKFKLKITYSNNKNEQITITAIPKEVKYYKRKICFSVFNTLTTEICDIPLNEITNIEQLPTKSSDSHISMTVVFKLKSRLAKTYKLKDDETSKGYDENGNLVIVNKNEDHNLLLKRLMRYGNCCEVISPKSFKLKMKNLILNTLKNYENSISTID